MSIEKLKRTNNQANSTFDREFGGKQIVIPVLKRTGASSYGINKTNHRCMEFVEYGGIKMGQS